MAFTSVSPGVVVVVRWLLRSHDQQAMGEQNTISIAAARSISHSL